MEESKQVEEIPSELAKGVCHFYNFLANNIHTF